MARAVSAEERQFALALALLGTKLGSTKDELFAQVEGYVGRQHDDALHRQFERDKEDLREMGLAIDVFTPGADADNNQESRYRILDGAVAAPEELSLTDEERRLVSLALLVWRDGGLSEESQRAALKLRADPDFRIDEPIGFEPMQRAHESAFADLKRAADRGRVVTFDYLKPGEATATRRVVEPWATILFRGRWMLHGFDQRAGGDRTFLMRRIVSRVETRTPREPFTVPDGAASAALETLERIWSEATARVRVLPGSDAEIRLTQRQGTTVDGDVLTVHHADANLLADELAGFGPDLIVLEPERQRLLVADRLERLAATHADEHDVESDASSDPAGETP